MTKTLLVIDDEKSITRIIGRIAESLGYEVVELNDPAQALDTFIRVEPDVLVLDMIMPDVDGVDVLRQVAAMGRQTRIIVTSGFGTGYLRLARAIAAFEERPAITELPKPFRRSDVISVLGDARGDVRVVPLPPTTRSGPERAHIEAVGVAA